MPDKIDKDNNFGQNAATDIIFDVAMGVTDPAAVATDILLDQLIDSLASHYSQATEEVTEKANKYFKKFETKDKAKQQALANGTISKKEYQKWRTGQIMIGERWKEMRDTLAEDLSHTNQIAADIINGHKSTAYALNHNYGTFQVEKDALVNTSYVLYDRDTVERLIAKNPEILPKTKIDIPKDLAWNKQKITSAIAQGVLQGESIPDLAKRLQSVAAMNHNSAVRNARTAMTGAQNAGREDSYKRAQKMGINMQQKWLATLDGRTRHSHRVLDGEIIDIGGVFSNKCRFPGDPAGPAQEVYNCRCTLVPVIKDFVRDDSWKYDVIDYQEWKKGGTGGFIDWLGEQAAPDSAITSAWGDKKYGVDITNTAKTFSTWDEFVEEFKKDLDNAEWLAQKANVPASVKNNLMKESAYSQYFDVKMKLKKGELTNEDFLKYKLQKYGGDDYKKLKNDPTLLKMFDNLSDDMKISNSEIYRGLNMSQADIDKLLKNGIIDMKGISSWSLSENEATGFALSGKKKAVMLKDASGEMHDGLNIDFIKAKSLQDEKEVLISPNEKWKITGSHYEHKKYTNAFGHTIEDDVLIIDVVPISDKVNSVADKAINKAANATTIAKEAQDQLDKLKIKAGNPMTKEDADTYKVNLLHDAADKTTTKNCQTTTFAYECRRKGYDVAALPKDDTFGDIFDVQDKLGQDQGNGWINTTTGKKPKKLIEHGIDEYKSKSEIIDELEKIVGTDGERYTLGVRWESSGAHAVNLDRDENGVIRIIDNQRGPKEKNTWTINEYLDEKNVKNIRALYRVDDCVPNAEYFNKIVVQADKMKLDMPTKVSGLKPGEYAKVSKIAKAQGEATSLYYKKWKYGIIDDPDIDDIFKPKTTSGVNKAIDTKLINKTDKTPVPTPISKTAVNTNLNVEAFKDKSASAVWKELNANKAGGGKFWNDITDIGKKQGVKPAEAWKKYLAGELDPSDTKKIEDHLAKIYKKADTVSDTTKAVTEIDDIAKIKANLPDKMTDLDLDQFDKAKKIIKNYYDNPDAGQIEAHYIQWKKGFLEDDNLDELFGKVKVNTVPTTAAKITPATPAVDMDLLKTKKVSNVWNELKDQGGTAYSQFWKTVGEVGKDYGFEKKQSKVWDLYINGKLKPEESKKIDDFLLKHYFNKADDVVKITDNAAKIAELENKLKKYEEYEKQMSGMNGKSFVFEKNGKKVNMYNIEDVDYAMAQGFMPADAEAKEFVKWTKGFDKDAIETEINKLKLQDKTAAQNAKSAATKSDDLIKAKAKLKKAEEELKKLSNPTYSGIWKDDVTLADYEAKKGTIAAKKIYYEDEINKLKNDPSYKSWLSDEDKQDKIWGLEKLLDDLIEYDTLGKEYEKYTKAIKDAQDAIAKATPKPIGVKFNPDDYSKDAKNNTEFFTSADKADKLHRSYLDSIWDSLTDKEKYGVWEYTRNSHPMNKSLSGYHDNWDRNHFIGYDKTDWGHEDNWRYLPDSGDFNNAKKFGKNGTNNVDYHRAITDTTTALEKSILPQNTYLVRGSDNGGLAGLIEGKGLISYDAAYKILQSGDMAQIKAAFEGQVIKNHAFTSTGIAKGTGFSGEVKYEIYAPKGTKAMYVEPQSHFGGSSGGIDRIYKPGEKYSYVGREAEVLVQRGTEYRITEITGSPGKLTVKMEIADQPDYFKYGDEDTFNNGATRHKK